MSPLVRALAPFARAPAPPGDRCELCAIPVAGPHPHLHDRESDRIACACAACGLLFAHGSPGRYRLVPDRVLHDPDLALDEPLWTRLGLPVRLAFCIRRSRTGRWAALYPGPAGVTEGEPDEAGWSELARCTPLVDAAEPDLEALLFRGGRDGSFDHFLVPVSAAWELAARIRHSWRGIEGGAEVRRELDRFFGALAATSRPWRNR